MSIGVRMDKVLVTGATGFIGLHCVEQLLRGGYEVRGTLRETGRGEALKANLAKHSV